jgi:hypothetical protein
MRWLAIVMALWLAGCATELDRAGRKETRVDVKYLAKTEIDRVADANRSEVVDGLLQIADKLYRRNPKEWRKGGQTSRQAAVDKLRRRQQHAWPELGGRREGQAAALAFTEVYDGDRVAALIFGLLTMTDAAFEHKDEFYLLDGLDEMKLFNCARNMEIAIWKLGHDRTVAGDLFLLSNELDPANRNLSFEREFGRQMGLLDFMAKIVADRNGRTLSRLTHSMVSTIFLPVSFLK